LIGFVTGMTSPYVETVLRPITKRAVLNRRPASFLSISKRYFRGEHARFLLFELLIFLLLATMALWPMLDAAAVIRTYLF
jgi:hypothetical protein